MRYLFIITLFIAAQFVFAAEYRPPPATVVLANVEEIEAAPLMRVPGTVFSRQDAKVAGEVRGRLVRVSEVGTRVRAGGEIAAIDDRQWVLARADSEAEVRRLKANLTYLSLETNRLRQLMAVNVAARTQFDQISSQRTMAEQELAKADVGHEQVIYSLERTKVQAPFDGQIVERLAEPGEFINVGVPITRLVNTTNLEVRAQCPLRVAPFLHKGLVVTVESSNGHTEVPISTVIPVGDIGSRSFELRINLPGNLWVIGTPVKVALPIDKTRLVVAVPRDALVLRNSGIFVFRVNGEGVAERITVTPGIGVNDWIEVTGNLATGDRVVTRGAERLRDGQAVVIIAG
jgi:RND family efflux transporter MFP subunit